MDEDLQQDNSQDVEFYKANVLQKEPLFFRVFQGNEYYRERRQIKTKQAEEEEKASYFRQTVEQNSTYVKVLVNYFQLMRPISSLSITVLPEIVQGFYVYLGCPLEAATYPQLCFLQDIRGSIPLHYLGLMWSIFIMPLFYLAGFIVGYVAVKVLFFKHEFNSAAISVALTFLFTYFAPDLVGRMVGLLNCRQVVDSSFVLQ